MGLNLTARHGPLIDVPDPALPVCVNIILAWDVDRQTRHGPFPSIVHSSLHKWYTVCLHTACMSTKKQSKLAYFLVSSDSLASVALTVCRVGH